MKQSETLLARKLRIQRVVWMMGVANSKNVLLRFLVFGQLRETARDGAKRSETKMFKTVQLLLYFLGGLQVLENAGYFFGGSELFWYK